MQNCNMCSRLRIIRFKGRLCADCGYAKKVSLAQAIFDESGGPRTEALSQHSVYPEVDCRAQTADCKPVSDGLVGRIIAGLVIVLMAMLSPDWDSEGTLPTETKRSGTRSAEMPIFSVC